MDGRIPSSSTSSLASHHLQQQQQQPPRRTNLRSSVSMFIEDSRITAVANADSSPLRGGGVIGGGGGCDASGGHCSPASSFYSVTSFSSSAAPQPQHTTATSSWNLRPAYCQISTTLPENITHQAPQGGSSSYHSSPVRSSRGCSSSPVRFSSRHGSSGSREIIHRIIREQSVENGDEPVVPPQQPPPPPPPSQPLRRSTLNVEPVISFINVKETLPHRLREDRAYTSVNLTLRSPTTPTAAQSPSSCVPPPTQCGGAPTVITQGFDHHSSNTSINTVVDMEAGTASFRHVHHHLPAGNHHQPTNLMYSTYSNSSDGFEAQVQIHFGPHGGTFTASRRRNHNISIRQMNSDLLSAQTERKDKLRTAIHDRKCMLAKLQTEIVQLRSQLQMNPFSELEKLKQENQRLRIECDFMAREVDLYQNGSVPLGETNEEFYQIINPGQSVEALFGITNSRGRNPALRRGSNPPPRPPPPKFLQSPDTPSGGVGSPTTGANPSNVAASNHHPDGEWRCSMCTFQNHRDLDFCEQCQMVRVKHGPSREQNIRIRVVRHHQQQPPQPRRVVHSWVM